MAITNDLDYDYGIGKIYQVGEEQFELLLKIYPNDDVLTYPIMKREDEVVRGYVKLVCSGCKYDFYVGYKHPCIKNIEEFTPIKPYPIGHIIPDIFNKLQEICYNWICNGIEYDDEIPASEKIITMEDVDIKSSSIIEISKQLNISIEEASDIKLKILSQE